MRLGRRQAGGPRTGPPRAAVRRAMWKQGRGARARDEPLPRSLCGGAARRKTAGARRTDSRGERGGLRRRAATRAPSLGLGGARQGKNWQGEESQENGGKGREKGGRGQQISWRPCGLRGRRAVRHITERLFDAFPTIGSGVGQSGHMGGKQEP